MATRRNRGVAVTQPIDPETELQINALLELSAYDVTLDPYDPREVTKSAAAHMRKLSEENATLSTERFDAMSRVVALQKERDAAQRDLAAIKADRDKILRCEEETEKKLAEAQRKEREANDRANALHEVSTTLQSELDTMQAVLERFEDAVRGAMDGMRVDSDEYKRLNDALRNKPIDETIGKPRWRVGRTSGRTLYRDEESVGWCDTPEIAAEIVERMNR